MASLRHNAPNIAPVWLWPNLLGLDAPLVAVCWQWMFSRGLGTPLPPVYHWILGLSVWCIYLADRLYDAFRSGKLPETGTDRLLFTRRNFHPLIGTVLIAGGVNTILILRHVPERLAINGSITAAAVSIYYILRISGKSRVASLVPREILCGTLFAIGTVIAPFTFSHYHFSFLIPVSLLGMLFSANCVLISIWEREADLAARDSSIASSGSRIVPRIAGLITLIAFVSCAVAFFADWQLHLAIALAAISLRLILLFQKNLSLLTLRVLADAVLLTPLLLIGFVR